MTQWLKQSTAATIKLGPFLDDTDGKTAETELTISQADIRLSKNGGDMAQSNDATGATHDELGYYNVPLDATDTGTLGRLKVMVHESGALPVWDEFMVVPANVYDALIGGSDYLQTDMVELSGDSTAADNAESFFDGTGYAGTNNVIPSVTTLAGHTPQTGDTFARLGAPAGASVSADVAAVKTDTAAIKAKTDNLPAEPAAVGSQMDLINAPNATAITAIQNGLATPTNITAGTITTVTNLTNAPTSGDLTATMKASVNAEVVDAISVDTIAELAQGIPSATPTLAQAVMLPYMKLRNKTTTTDAELSIYNDAGTKIAKAALSDDGTTFTKAELDSGA
ncbi:MAG: hypothetical protein RBT11_14275 [Desulfobacterales bacterium]|jgi:hypothetical protein|nr:hypothetical protein [Desulfobacterales bacterium]